MRLDKHIAFVETYILNSAEIPGGASKVMLDLFNAAGSGHNVVLNAMYVAPKSDVAVTGVVSARFDVWRTTSVGTGGTAATYNQIPTSAMNISPMDTKNTDLTDSLVTARSVPTGGASKQAWLTGEYVFPEETSASAILQQPINILPDSTSSQGIVLREGEGIVVQQGTVASVNSFVFSILFSITKSYT